MFYLKNRKINKILFKDFLIIQIYEKNHKIVKFDNFFSFDYLNFT
jgi:hypothetical protein